MESWNDGPTKSAIVDFVGRVTTEGPDFVAPQDRIAVFDNDGTLWCEKPAYVQLDFLVRRLAAQAAAEKAAKEAAAKAEVEAAFAIYETALGANDVGAPVLKAAAPKSSSTVNSPPLNETPVLVTALPTWGPPVGASHSLNRIVYAPLAGCPNESASLPW